MMWFLSLRIVTIVNMAPNLQVTHNAGDSLDYIGSYELLMKDFAP